MQVGRRRKSIGSQHALGRGPKTIEAIDAILVGIVDRVTRRMRAAERVGRTVTLRLRFDDFTRATRSQTLTQSTAQSNTVLAAARTLLAAATPLIKEQGLTLIAVSVGNVADSDALQLALPFHKNTNDALDIALDRVNDRFGSATVTRAVLLGRERGDAPMLPD